MIYWFYNKEKITKSISITYHKQHWKLFLCRSNGARRGVKEDTCYDYNIHFLGIFLSYTNWDYNKKYRYSVGDIRRKKIKNINAKRFWK